MGDLHGLMVTICSLSKHGAPAVAQSTPIHNLINPRLNNLVLGMSAISFHHLSNNDAMTPTVKPILLYPDNSKAIKDDITWLLATSCHRSTCTTRLQTHLLLQSRDMGAYISYVTCFSEIIPLTLTRDYVCTNMKSYFYDAFSATLLQDKVSIKDSKQKIQIRSAGSLQELCLRILCSLYVPKIKLVYPGSH